MPVTNPTEVPADDAHLVCVIACKRARTRYGQALDLIGRDLRDGVQCRELVGLIAALDLENLSPGEIVRIARTWSAACNLMIAEEPTP